ncbi:MAG: alanine--tRNA ligase-related protein, partial [Planctomycetota bacterium]|nr:alanine--tRNA ligase-related protein [Planctomycetota bacterium]
SRFDKKDNFWEMGATGPCGPCSEIHFDGTPDGSGGHLVNADDPQVIEIWNLVFMQFNRGDDGTLVPLPAKHVDTGMGFERIVRVLQGKDSNYDTDVFTGIFEAIRTRTGARPYGADLKDPLDTAYRILADHLRCLSVALADGARPGADGRNYVLRRILRRAVRHVSQTFGVQEPCLFEMVPAVTQSLGPIFPELIQEEGKVQAAIHDEEVAFHRTLGRGTELFAQAAAEAGSSKVIDGATAFRLHDTFGFPVDLTQVMAEEAGLQVDLQAYESEMEAARERSRSGGGAGDDADLPPERLAALAERVAATDDSARDSHEGCSATVGALLVSGNLVEEAQPGDEVSVVLDQTNFYAEMGGQVKRLVPLLHV